METISLPFASFVVQSYGLPGLIFIIWWFDHRAQVKQRQLDAEKHAREIQEHAAERAAHAAEITRILGQYRDDVSEIKALYQNNADLARAYEKSIQRQEKLYEETLSVIALNTRSQERLVVSISANEFCPNVRAGRPNR
ncbi:MAG TPA: hypothetical protein VF795_11640 [Desulfuromonadaceae bacterium]